MANPYELWQTHQLLGMFRDTQPETWYFGQFFNNQLRSTDEWIDFEKLPIRSRKMAPFVKPLGRGHGVFTDKQVGYRFKPANSVVEDSVDPLRPLTFQPGIGESRFAQVKLSPAQRTELIKAQMMAEMQTAMERRWEWMKARAIIDGQVTCAYKDGSSVVVNFQRAAGHTLAPTSGNKWGESGIKALTGAGGIEAIIDTMGNAEFGGVPARMTMGGDVFSVLRNDAEILAHLDVNIKGGLHVVDRGLKPSGKVFKFGDLYIGGGSGQSIEMWVNNETYQDDSGASQRYLGAKDVIFTSTADAIMGYECFGRIVDKDAGYEAIPAFPKNFITGDRVKVENLSIESAPLMVPINPNATLKVTGAVA